jgi:RNA polymerase sigma factor (TIGR02999 family)
MKIASAYQKIRAKLKYLVNGTAFRVYNVRTVTYNDRDQITQRLREWSGGNSDAFETVLPLVYDELHRQASRYLRRERPNHTIQTTELINEAYLKLVGQHSVNWQNRSHFFGIAAQVMRRILVDHARSKHRLKRGGNQLTLVLDETVSAATNERNIDLVALDEALDRLAEKDRQQARIVELRYFSGLELVEVAKILGVSRTTVSREWRMAKAWLRRELTR